MNEVLDLLSNGSVWTKNAGKNEGQKSKVLWVTNLTLSAKAQEKHPPQVVYVNEEGNVYNRPVTEFIEQYTFYNVDPDLESRLDQLLVFNEEDYDDPEADEDEDEGDDEDQVDVGDLDDGDNGEILINSDPAQKTTASLADQLAEENEEPAERHSEDNHGAPVDPTTVTFILNSERPTALSADQLYGALAAYAQEPNKEMTMTQHRLLFELSDVVTVQGLKDSFHPDSGYATVDAFVVSGPHYREIISWTDYVGVFYEVAGGQAYAAVVVGEDANAIASAEPVEDPQVESNQSSIEQVADMPVPQTEVVQDVEFTELNGAQAEVVQDVEFTESNKTQSSLVEAAPGADQQVPDGHVAQQ